MNIRIETLEDLNEKLAPDSIYYYSISWQQAETTAEKLAWHLLEGLPFDLDIILKGMRTWEDGIDREAEDAVERLFERYGEAFSFSNKALCDWLFSTPLEHLAAHTAYVMRAQAFNKIANYYDAAQDHYADYWYEWDDYQMGKTTPRSFIVALEKHIDEVNQHIAEGQQQGLTMDEIVLHDCTWGLMPSHFDPDMIAASKDILKRSARRCMPHRCSSLRPSGSRRAESTSVWASNTPLSRAICSTSSRVSTGARRHHDLRNKRRTIDNNRWISRTKHHIPHRASTSRN